jgi:hypothetical protein
MSVVSWAVGFGVGAGVVAANFWAMETTLRLVLLPGARAPRLLAALGFGARLIVAGLILGFALRYLSANPIAMVLGVSVVPFGLLIRSLAGCQKGLI